MTFRIIELPAFKAASSGVDSNFDFSEKGILGKFDAYFSALTPSLRDSFMPRDFLFFDAVNGGMVWLYALSEEIDAGDFDVIDVEGGYFLTYVYKDGDEKARRELFEETKDYIAKLDSLELDISETRFMMGHIITPKRIIEQQGWSQMENFIPIKLKELAG